MTDLKLPHGLRAADWRPMAGGSICRVWAVTLDDGRAAVVKVTPYDADLEREGLAALADAGAPVPKIYGWSSEVLVLARVGADGGGPAWEDLGRALAVLHRASSPTFGWHRYNLLGRLVQCNAPATDWPDFFGERRLRPFLDAPALSPSVRRRVEDGIAHRLRDLLSHEPVPSLVHGDLWPGNIVDGRWMIDPAVHFADREYELAVLGLFGGVPEACARAYDAAWPLPAGWLQRRPLLQLPLLLAHVKMFGAGYVGAVTARLDALGW